MVGALKRSLVKILGTRFNLFCPSNTFSFVHAINKAKQDFEFPMAIPVLDLCLIRKNDYFSHLEGEIVSFDMRHSRFVQSAAM